MLPFDFGGKGLQFPWSSVKVIVFLKRDVKAVYPFSVIPQGALAFLKWAGGCVPDTLIKLHIINYQKELTEYIMPALSLTFRN